MPRRRKIAIVIGQGKQKAEILEDKISSQVLYDA